MPLWVRIFKKYVSAVGILRGVKNRTKVKVCFISKYYTLMKYYLHE